MYKVCISGYYGFNNIGDESVLLALTSSLRARFGEQIEITVLSSNPKDTAEKFGVKAVNRKSVLAIERAVRHADLLISGGGSLLQDVTSNRSIAYYLGIIRLALLYGKKVFIYSQGIGPIHNKENRRRVAHTLQKVHGIVVRDEQSKELLVSIGLPAERVSVACDPVIGMNRVGLEVGRALLAEAGFQPKEGKRVIGFAIRERNVQSPFVDELEEAIRKLIKDGDQVVLIPFFHAEDEAVMEELARRIKRGVTCIRHKCLTEETLSLIGCMDILVGVRLHSLIYAAIMGVPCVGISYDPKINSFMNSIGQKALCSVYDFRAGYLLEEIDRTEAGREAICAETAEALKRLRNRLTVNEDQIERILA